MMNRVRAEHGIVCRLPGEKLSYFGWPSIARMDDGTLVVASSGLRAYHVCPWGKTVLHFSKDGGATWSDSIVITDSPIDDRDAGIISLGGSRLLVSWFTHDIRKYIASDQDDKMKKRYLYSMSDYEQVLQVSSHWKEEMLTDHLGSFVKLSEDGMHWGEVIRVPVSAPHGPIRLSNGDILYLGKDMAAAGEYMKGGMIRSIISSDGGIHWKDQGYVPIPNDAVPGNFHEPHAVELASGKIVGMIRYKHWQHATNYDDFSLFQTESLDGGQSWSAAKPVGVSGSPPHLIRHSSGAMICVYGYRNEPYGQRAMISHDDGVTWDADHILRDGAPDWDLGYPASVELADGCILTVYYQKYTANEKPSLLWSKWRLPDAGLQDRRSL